MKNKAFANSGLLQWRGLGFIKERGVYLMI